MAAIPVIQRIEPFNAGNSNTVKFSISGSAQQIFYNELTIANFSTPETPIYQQQVQTFQYQHEIPANTLTNGQQYVATIKVLSQSETVVGESGPAFFYCFSDPILDIPTIVNDEVGNQTVLFEGTYTQTEGELVESYQFKLYSNNQNLLISSGAIFLQDPNDPMEFEFSELENRTLYYIEFSVSTQNELFATTGLIPFTPRYVAPRFKSAIELYNQPETASVEIKCNVVRILGISDSGEPIFLGDGTVDLTSDGFTFEEGFDIKSSFTIEIWVKNIGQGMFFKLSSNQQESIEIIREGNKLILYKILNPNYILQKLTSEIEINENLTYIFIQHIDGWMNFEYETVVI